MSKSDKLAVAVAAIGIAMGFLFGGPVWGFAFLLIGVVFLVAYLNHESSGEQADLAGGPGMLFLNGVPETQDHNQQQERVSSADKPDVALVWDWQEDVRRNKSLLGYTEKLILIHNRSDRYIYNVKIAPIQLSQTLAFDLINEIPPGAEHVAIGRWNGRSSAFTNYVYFFGNTENEKVASELGWVYKKAHNRGISDLFLKIPMTVTYDAGGVVWESTFDFDYDPGDESCFVKRQPA